MKTESTSVFLSHTMLQFKGFRTSTPRQNRQFIVEMSKQSIDGFVGELNFYNHSTHTSCEMKVCCDAGSDDGGQRARAPGFTTDFALS